MVSKIGETKLGGYLETSWTKEFGVGPGYGALKMLSPTDIISGQPLKIEPNHTTRFG